MGLKSVGAIAVAAMNFCSRAIIEACLLLCAFLACNLPLTVIYLANPFSFYALGIPLSIYIYTYICIHIYSYQCISLLPSLLRPQPAKRHSSFFLFSHAFFVQTLLKYYRWIRERESLSESQLSGLCPTERSVIRKGPPLSWLFHRGMANELPRIAAVQFPSLPSSISPESRYWRKYKSPIVIKEYASVTHIHFSPVSPHDFAVSSSTRVQIYSARTRTVAKTISRFTDVTYAAEFRKDGRLLVSGDATGLVQVFDTSSRSILRTINLHRLPVQVTKFSPHDLTTMLTGSDDKTVRVWDIPTQAPVNTFKGHEDYVRTAEFMPSSPSLFISGSYDGTVRLWDARVPAKGGEVQRLNHEANVEQVTPLASGTTIVSAGGTEVRVWDLASGSQTPLRAMQNHARGVTCLAKNSNGSRLLSGGLDGHLKIYDTTEWKVIHGVKYPSAVLSCAVAPDDRHLVVGMANGLLSIRTRSKASEVPKAVTLTSKQQRAQSKTVQRFKRGADYKGDKEGIILDDANKAKRLRNYDHAIRRYAYSDALDMVLTSGTNSGDQGGVDAVSIFSVLSDMRHRGGLRQALQNRDDISLLPVLNFLVRNISNERMCGVLIDVTMVLLEIYGPALGGARTVDELLGKLDDKVRLQITRAKEAEQVLGMLTMLYNA